ALGRLGCRRRRGRRASAGCLSGRRCCKHATEYDWQAREREERRQRACFALSEQDADAARAFGCLLELPDPNGRSEHRYATDPEWLADRLVQKIAAHVAAEEERKQHEPDRRKRATV